MPRRTADIHADVHVTQPEDENYGLARDFCLQKAYYNSFPDVHSGATEEYYAE